MATNEISKEYLSASDHGRHINITISGSPGTLIHTTTADPNSKDEIWLYGVNNASDEAILFVEWGGTDPVENLHTVGIPASQGDVLIIAGKVLGSGLAVRAYSDHATATSSGINISGWVNRQSEVV